MISQMEFEITMINGNLGKYCQNNNGMYCVGVYEYDNLLKRWFFVAGCTCFTVVEAQKFIYEMDY